MRLNSNEIILPKGTILNLNGFAVKLIADTVVISSAVQKFGVEKAINEVSDMPSRNITQQTTVN